MDEATDVPELTDELIDHITAQCDAESDRYGVREPERIRDHNLVAILLALEAIDWAIDWAVGRTVPAQRRDRRA